MVAFPQLALCVMVRMPGKVAGWADPHEMCDKSEQTEEKTVKWKHFPRGNNNEGEMIDKKKRAWGMGRQKHWEG